MKEPVEEKPTVRYVDTIIQPGPQIVYKQAPPVYVQNLRDFYMYNDDDYYYDDDMSFYDELPLRPVYIRGGRPFRGWFLLSISDVFVLFILSLN